ncbi:hypothetical protein OE88DRAFT_830648 [Heliocybe sulcata]|uniref:Uncharacterized protein n=1 Tax=Heliocybe sulcata TaxID=5364 RepID=A0A5C3MTX6_9AGAM|nr:hypothetical protein OE88DRAFT_830648 [Heliocybe sulcata]
MIGARRYSPPTSREIKPVDWVQEMGRSKNKRRSGITFYRRDCDCGIPTPPMSPDFAGPSHVLFSADDEATTSSGTVDPTQPITSEDKAISESASIDNDRDNAISASPSGDSNDPETISDSPSGDNTDLISLYTDTDSASVYSEQTISSEEQTICDSPSGDNSALIALYANLPSDDEDLKMTPVPGIIVTSPTQDALPTPPASPVLEVAVSESKPTDEGLKLPVPQLDKPHTLPVPVKDEEPTVVSVVDGRYSIPLTSRSLGLFQSCARRGRRRFFVPSLKKMRRRSHLLFLSLRPSFLSFLSSMLRPLSLFHGITRRAGMRLCAQASVNVFDAPGVSARRIALHPTAFWHDELHNETGGLVLFISRR